MPPVTVEQLQRAVAAVVKNRRAVEEKERALVASLNEALRRLGYTVVPERGRAAPTGRRQARRRRGAR